MYLNYSNINDNNNNNNNNNNNYNNNNNTVNTITIQLNIIKQIMAKIVQNRCRIQKKITYQLGMFFLHLSYNFQNTDRRIILIKFFINVDKTFKTCCWRSLEFQFSVMQCFCICMTCAKMGNR